MCCFVIHVLHPLPVFYPNPWNVSYMVIFLTVLIVLLAPTVVACVHRLSNCYMHIFE